MKKIKKFIEKFYRAVVPIAAVMVGAFVMIGAGANDHPGQDWAKHMEPWGWIGAVIAIIGLVIPFINFKDR